MRTISRIALMALAALLITTHTGCASTKAETQALVSNVGTVLNSMNQTIGDLAVAIDDNKFSDLVTKIDEGNSYVQEALPALQESIALDGSVDPNAAGALAGNLANMVLPGSGGLVGGAVGGLFLWLRQRKKTDLVTVALEETVKGVDMYRGNGASEESRKALKVSLVGEQSATTKQIVRGMR